MVEVFKTNVQLALEAEILLEEIHGSFPNCVANFDLEDCDRILRVKSTNGAVPANELIELLGQKGYQAEVLCDVEVGRSAIVIGSRSVSS